MPIVISNDGTNIAFDRTGQGPALILVGGAFEQRAMDSETAKLAAFPLLAEHFSVFHYDRRAAATAPIPSRSASSARSRISRR